MTNSNELLTAAKALQPLIAKHAAWADSHRQLAPEVAQAMAAAGLYRAALPTSAGGVGADPATQIQLIETVAQADGACGWNLMIGMENYGLVAPGMSQCADLLSDPNLILCSSTAAAFYAEPQDNGFRISGRWPFASGCHNSQLFSATVFLDKEKPNNRAYAVLTPDQYQIEDTWHVEGMRGSGSHDISVAQAWVPANRIISPIANTTSTDALLRFPLAARLAYNKVGVALGITRAAIQEFCELAANKTPGFTRSKLSTSSHAARAVASAELAWQQGRQLVMMLIEEFWSASVDGHNISAEKRALFQIACSGAVQQCTTAVQSLGEAAGTSANLAGTRFNRCLRDLPVVRSHITVAPTHIEDGGRILLGQPATGLMLKGLQ